MKVEIDQSGKIEDTAKPTVLAFSNSKQSAIKISARTKRQIQEIFRRRGQIRLFIYRTFAALIFLLIRDYLSSIHHVVIDTEYPGHEKLIKDILLEFLRRNKLKEPQILFKRIGSKPKVHYAAYDVFSGKKKPNKSISFSKLAKFVIKK